MSLNLFIADKAPSHRQKKVASELKFLISQILLRGDLPPQMDDDSNPRTLVDPVTITHVDVSPDLHHANVFFMPLGGNNQENILDFLQNAAGYMRKVMGKKLHLRVIPRLNFVIDQSFKHTEKIDNILNKINKDQTSE
jgi:ribosome-binding factor A